MKKHHLAKKQEKRQSYVATSAEPSQYTSHDKPNEHDTDQNHDKDVLDPLNQGSQDIETHEPIEISEKIVLKDNSQIFVVDSGQYLSTVDNCTTLTSDVNVVAVTDNKDTSPSHTLFEGSGMKLYRLDQSLVQIHKSGGQVTISKITSKKTANF
jgi:hypothetical protein